MRIEQEGGGVSTELQRGINEFDRQLAASVGCMGANMPEISRLLVDHPAIFSIQSDFVTIVEMGNSPSRTQFVALPKASYSYVEDWLSEMWEQDPRSRELGLEWIEEQQAELRRTCHEQGLHLLTPVWVSATTGSTPSLDRIFVFGAPYEDDPAYYAFDYRPPVYSAVMEAIAACNEILTASGISAAAA